MECDYCAVVSSSSFVRSVSTMDLLPSRKSVSIITVFELSPIVLKRAKSKFCNIEIMQFIGLMHCEKSTSQFLINFSLSLC